MAPSGAKRGPLRREANLIIGVDIGGTNIRAGVVTGDGRILAEARRPAKAMEGPATTLSMVVEAIEDALKRVGASSEALCGIGMGVPGRHRSRDGVCLFSPNFAGWQNVQVVAPVRDAFGVATFMLNDVKTATLGEHRFGAGKGYDHVVMITLGTGIGCGVISDGELRLGSGEGFSEAGHMIIQTDGPLCGCGSSGCWEALAGRDGIVAQALRIAEKHTESKLSALAQVGEVTPADIFKAAQEGDEAALEAARQTAFYVGIGCSNLIQVYNPQVLVIGGGIAQAGPILLDRVREVVKERARMVPAETCQIVPSGLGDDAGIIGGAVLVMREMEKGASGKDEG
jgi:glucokinase